MELTNAPDILRHRRLSSAVGFALETESLEGMVGPLGLCYIMPWEDTWYLASAQKASVPFTNNRFPLPALEKEKITPSF